MGEVEGGWISREITKLVVEFSLSGIDTPEDVTERASREIGLREVSAERGQSQILWGMRTGEHDILGICM